MEIQYGKTETELIEKMVEMLKKIIGDLGAAVVLIANENLTALRTLIKYLTNSVSKPACVHKMQYNKTK